MAQGQERKRSLRGGDGSWLVMSEQGCDFPIVNGGRGDAERGLNEPLGAVSL